MHNNFLSSARLFLSLCIKLQQTFNKEMWDLLSKHWSISRLQRASTVKEGAATLGVFLPCFCECCAKTFIYLVFYGHRTVKGEASKRFVWLQVYYLHPFLQLLFEGADESLLLLQDSSEGPVSLPPQFPLFLHLLQQLLLLSQSHPQVLSQKQRASSTCSTTKVLSMRLCFAFNWEYLN